MREGHGFFETYDILLLFVGLALLLITLGRQLFERLNLNTTFVYLVVGVLAGPLLLDMAPDDARVALPVLERVAEFAVIISLIVLGIRIGRPLSWSRWQSTVRLVLIAMPATILLVAATGMWLLGLALGPAVLLGAILAPTDPILAGPLEEESLEDEREDRFGLSSEAGLNDGFAFPFVYLGIYLTWRPHAWSEWIGYWLLRDLLYAVAFALPLGWLLGHVCGKVYRRLRQDDGVSRKRHLFIPLALLLAVYGLVEVLGAYGFLAAFTAGLAFRRALDEQRRTLEQFANFTESVDELAKAAVLIIVGALMPWAELWRLGLPLLGFALALMLLLRPLVILAATMAGGFERLDRIYWAWFGIRGIGSLYYMSYAINAGLDETQAQTIFTITAGTVLISIVLHGLSVRPFLERFEGESEVEE
jgi:sodium/hydrogen antiporter